LETKQGRGNKVYVPSALFYMLFPLKTSNLLYFSQILSSQEIVFLLNLLTYPFILYILYMYSENSIYKAGDFLNIILSNAVDQPIYVQIKNQIKEQILQGELKEKESLPSIRKLAKDIQVSVITTKKAYEELEKEGFIETFPGKGSFVAAQNPALLKDNQLKIIEDQMVTMLEQSKSFNISLEELIEMMKLLYEE